MDQQQDNEQEFDDIAIIYFGKLRKRDFNVSFNKQDPIVINLSRLMKTFQISEDGYGRSTLTYLN